MSLFEIVLVLAGAHPWCQSMVAVLLLHVCPDNNVSQAASKLQTLSLVAPVPTFCSYAMSSMITGHVLGFIRRRVLAILKVEFTTNSFPT